MAIQDTDLLYVQRPSGPEAGGYKITAGDLLSNSSSVQVGDTAPDPAEEGDLWWCTTDGRLYVFYDDGGTQQWVDASPPGSGADLSYEYPSSGFKQTIQSRLEQYVSVKDFGATGDGVTDDTAAIQAAINRGAGGTIYFPKGNYKVSSALQLAASGTKLVGSSRDGSKLIGADNSKSVIQFKSGHSFMGLESLNIRYDALAPTTTVAVLVEAGYTTLSDFVIAQSGIGVKWKSTVAGKAHNFEILDFTASAVQVEACNDVFINSFVINAGDATGRGTLGAIRLQDKCEAIIVADGDVIFGDYSLICDATNNALGQRPGYNYFTNVYFDSQQKFSYLDKTVECNFVNCWWSGSRVASPQAALRLMNTQSIKFTSCLWFNCGGHGCEVTADARNSTFIGCSFQSNGKTRVSSAGLRIADNSSEFTVTNCIANNDLYLGEQEQGILIGNNSSKYSITNNSVEGNKVAGILVGSGTSEGHISGNIGYKSYNRGLASIPDSATFVDVPYDLPEQVSASRISVTRGSPPGGTSSFWVDNVTTTTFRINVNQNPISTITFTWQVDSQNR